MSAKQAISNKVRETSAAAAKALDSETSGLYAIFDHLIRELEVSTRESFQAKVNSDYKSILRKLENNEALDTNDYEMLKLLIVGEAKYYLKYENNLEDWRTELKRLVKEMEKIEARGLDDIDALLQLQALCRDARGVLPDITFYYREKERLTRFETATSGTLDAVSRQTLAEVLRAMMQSDKM